MSDSGDRAFMAHAIELAARGLETADPNPRVGCVIVRNGVVVGAGWHVRAGEAHAEVHALRDAGEAARGATAYITLEPCRHEGRTPPCTRALLEAGIARVVVAMEDPDPRMAGASLEELRAAGVRVECGLLQTRAEALNPGFVMRHRAGRPFVRCKLGSTLDGRTATAAGESRWITDAAARRDVQRLRARSSAIMTGIGTVLADDPSLTVRPDELGRPAAGGPPHQPLRVVADARLRIPAGARLLAGGGPVLLATAASAPRADLEAHAGVEVVRCAGRDGRVDLAALMGVLARHEVNEVLLEAGPVLSGAMLRAGLVDEIVIYMAPTLLGDEARGQFTLPRLDRLADAVRLEIDDVRAVGRDWRITARPRSPTLE